MTAMKRKAKAKLGRKADRKNEIIWLMKIEGLLFGFVDCNR